jgi:hypothetical protein
MDVGNSFHFALLGALGHLRLSDIHALVAAFGRKEWILLCGAEIDGDFLIATLLFLFGADLSL